MHFDGASEGAIKQEEEEQSPTVTLPQANVGEVSVGGITIKNGKKRGNIFKCESCSKVCSIDSFIT